MTNKSFLGEFTIHKAIKKHAGLSDSDDRWIWEEVRAIVKSLKRAGLVIVKQEKPND